MRGLLILLLSLVFSVVHASVLSPGQSVDVSFEPTTGEHSPVWTTDNPTLHLSSVGFLCHVIAQAYFGGTATVTCTYQDRIGSTSYTRTRRWSFSCADTKISIAPIFKSLKVGDSFQLSWSFNTTTFLNPSIQFTGYDQNILSVSPVGLVTAKAEGVTKIHVKSNLGTNSEICNVTVNATASGGNQTGAAMYYDSWDTSKTTVVAVESPGTLEDYITADLKYNITNLTVKGPLNGTDLRLLRDMCGLNETNGTTAGKLIALDLKDAVFVEGGKWYVKAWQDYLYTDDIADMPDYAFAWMKNLKRIRFPKYCTVLTNGALLQCQSLHEMLIPPGVVTLNRESLNGGYDDMPMTSLYLPSSLVNFDVSIYRCRNLTDVYCYAKEPPTTSFYYSFATGSNCTKGTLYVPKGSASAYWRAQGWREFNDIKDVLEVCNTLSINVGPNGKACYNGTFVEQKYGAVYSGYQAFEVLETAEVVVDITPEIGYVISYISLDGKSREVPADGHLKIGKLSNHAKLEIEFEESASVDNIAMDTLDEKFSVFNMQGVLLKQNVHRKELEKLSKGVYIVRSGTASFKIIR